MTHGTRDARVPAGVGSVRTLVETGEKVKPPFLALAEARRRRVHSAGKKNLTAPFTSRDLFGVCRGACTVCDARECPGGYLKATRDYGKDAWEEARRRGDLRHPCNKDDMTNCTRCGCEAGKHAVDEGADARERGNDAFARGDYHRALLAYSR